MLPGITHARYAQSLIGVSYHWTGKSRYVLGLRAINPQATRARARQQGVKLGRSIGSKDKGRRQRAGYLARYTRKQISAKNPIEQVSVA